MLIVADENIPGLEHFAPLGTVVLCSGRDINATQVRDADILLVRSVTRVDAALLAGSAVRFVATATAGTDHIDRDFLQRAKIPWTYAPGSNADSVVDYVFSALCAIDDYLERLLTGGVVGIIGCGNVGSRLYRRLCALGIRCIAYDPFLDPSQHPGLTDFDTVLRADVICLHTPFTVAGPWPTRHLLDRAALRALRPDSLLINAGRGGVIDEAALLDLMGDHASLRVVLDVWETEPRIHRELMALTTIATPHIAGYSLDGKWRGAEMIYRACCDFAGVAPTPTDIAADAPPTVTMVANASIPDTVREAALTVYDVRDDDARLRAAIGVATDDEVALRFDQLRKAYPVRREFSVCGVDSRGGELAQKQQLALRALGFGV